MKDNMIKYNEELKNIINKIQTEGISLYDLTEQQIERMTYYYDKQIKIKKEKIRNMREKIKIGGK